MQKRSLKSIQSLGIFKEIAEIIASYAVYYPHNYHGERANTAKEVVHEITRDTPGSHLIGIYVADYVGVDEEHVEDS